MIDDVERWNRLAALLPDADARTVRDCWDIGEQEAGLGLLVSGILTHRLPISETVRAQLSVLAEDWGEREALAPRILRCRGDGRASVVELIEHGSSAVGGASVRGPSGRDPAHLVLVPWIACRRCGQVLMRAHDREPWGDLSHLARRYVVVSPDRSTVRREFPADAVSHAFEALLNECP
ncbi:hypothetical protein [Streptomyces chromofuscus]|uniref:hypothetical protein n=1 Tax=Streptomyces chromofuscus TaxID=42881 RepID=UPI001E284E9B|nr:hypothetical protein [Streptomyces chromofuscus]